MGTILTVCDSEGNPLEKEDVTVILEINHWCTFNIKNPAFSLTKIKELDAIKYKYSNNKFKQRNIFGASYLDYQDDQEPVVN